MTTPRRVAVVGCTGAGKSTAAARLADKLGVPLLELDGVYHQAGWRPLPEVALRERVTAWLDARDGWVADGNYTLLRDVIWARADTVLWIDPPRGEVMWNVTRRTLRRALWRERLWNGNREPLRNLLPWDPERSVIAWAWRRHPELRSQLSSEQRDPRWAHLRFVRVATRRGLQRWLAALAPGRAVRADGRGAGDARSPGART